MRYKIGLLMFFVILSFSFYAQTQTGENILSMNEFSNENVSTKKKRKHCFEQYVYIPELTMSTLFLGTGKDALQGIGPAVGLDMIFTKQKSGFSFFIHNTTACWFSLPKDIENYSGPKDVQLLFIPVTSFHFLFGYTYGRGKDLEVSAGIGPGIVFVPFLFSLTTELTISKYFSKKYGIVFSVKNALPLIPFSGPKREDGRRTYSFLFADVLDINIGAAFRLN